MRRWVGISCILLVLMMTGLEAMHAHADEASPGATRPCAICISVHSNAPATNVDLLPVLTTLEIVKVSYQNWHTSKPRELKRFIRPPPTL